MTYNTINDGEATPLQIPEGTSVAPRSTNNKRTSSSSIVRALMVGTAMAVGALVLRMAGPAKMVTTMHKTRNVDGMVVVSSGATHVGSHPRVTAAGGAGIFTEEYDPNRHICFVDIDNPGKYCWYPEDTLPYGNWKVDSPHGNNNCGSKCEKTQDDPEGTECVPAPRAATFWGRPLHYYINDAYVPFQTCWQNAGETNYCWTNNWRSTELTIYGVGQVYHPCVPVGGDWRFLDARYVNPVTDPNSCGKPCQVVRKPK